MIKKLAVMAALLFAANATAQTSNDFTLTANDNNTYNLYTLLGEGKHIVIHFTSTN